MAQVVEAQGTQASCLTGPLEATSQRRAVERPTERVAEDELIAPRVVGAPAETIERRRGLVGKRNPPNLPRLGG